MMFRGQEIKLDHFEPCIHRGSKRKIRCCGQWVCRLHHTDCRLKRYDDAPNLLACNECDDKELEYNPIIQTADPISKLLVPLTAVTSLNPNPLRKDRQLNCLLSWLNAGIEVLAVNTSEELDSMPWLNGIAEQFVSNETATSYDRPVQKVSSLIRAGMLTGCQFMLINSDIEINGDVSILSDSIKSQDRLTIGVRYNHESGASREAARRETAGLDIFVMTPEIAARIPSREFGIGKPAWDYWLPHQVRLNGVKFNWIQRPLFFHESHTLGWSNSDWKIGHDMILRDYGISITQGNFRKKLESW